MSSRPGASSRAFTLLELLVGVAVIGILASLLLGATAKMRQTTATAACAQNLRQIYSGFVAYTGDNDGYIPPAHAYGLSGIYEGYDFNQYWWMPAYLTQYLIKDCDRWSTDQVSQAEAKIFNCPARNIANDTFWLSHSSPAVSYVMADPGPSDQYKMVNIQSPSKKLLITEGRHSAFWSGVAYTNPEDTRDTSRFLRRFHVDSMNLLFYDGHIEKFAGPDQDLQQYLP
jgi:prepilin-type N-terminal cleavage/methylation domain-containing protein/prepilin-type processing-associated H-X9-DG protein